MARPWCQSALKILLEVGCRNGFYVLLLPQSRFTKLKKTQLSYLSLSSLDRANPLYQENALQYSLSHTLILGSLGDGLLELRELLPDAEQGPHANAHTRRSQGPQARAQTHTIHIHTQTRMYK